MNHPIRIASVAACGLLVGACSLSPDYSGLGAGLGCALEQVSTSVSGVLDSPRTGDRGRAELHGLCSALELCSEHSALLLGAAHGVWLTVELPASGGGSSDTAVALTSAAPAIVTSSVDDAGCVTAIGALNTRGEGEARLEVVADGVTVDGFSLRVAAVDSAVLDDLGGGAEPHAPTLSIAESHWLRVTARDAAGGVLAVGDSVGWQLADDGVLGWADDSEPPTGALAEVTALAVGDTTVTATVGGLDVTLPVRVVP